MNKQKNKKPKSGPKNTNNQDSKIEKDDEDYFMDDDE